MYSIKMCNINNIVSKASEIKKSKVERVTWDLTIYDFCECLYKKQKSIWTIYLSKTKLHQIYTKDTLNHLDNER